MFADDIRIIWPWWPKHWSSLELNITKTNKLCCGTTGKSDRPDPPTDNPKPSGGGAVYPIPIYLLITFKANTMLTKVLYNKKQ